MELINAPQPAPPAGLSLKEKILLGIGSLIALTGTVLIGRKIVLNHIANKEENLTLDEGSTATYAKQIKMSFENDGWPGTNTAELRRIMMEIPSKKDTTKVAGSYKRLYHRNMYADMQSELQSTEYNEMLSIMAEKPTKAGRRGKSINLSKKYDEWAKRLKAAFDKTYGLFRAQTRMLSKRSLLKSQLRLTINRLVIITKNFTEALLTMIYAPKARWENTVIG
jgi:hypothetical protein